MDWIQVRSEILHAEVQCRRQCDVVGSIVYLGSWHFVLVEVALHLALSNVDHALISEPILAKGLMDS